MQITVMGATGQTGHAIVQRLLKTPGIEVLALGRNAERLAALEKAGARTAAGDAADAGFLTRAFQGADAVYTLLGTDRRAPDYAARQAREGEAIARAVQASGVRHVVALSSLGADRREGRGLIAGLYDQEQRLARIGGVHVLFLRPASFFENFLDALPLIGQLGFNADAVRPDLAVPMVAVDDIADAAARALRARDWQGLAVRELLGPRDLSYAEATRLVGDAIGRPGLPYVQLSGEEMTAALVEAGLSAGFARLYVEMADAINVGQLDPVAGRSPGNTTPGRFEDFARGLPAIVSSRQTP